MQIIPFLISESIEACRNTLGNFSICWNFCSQSKFETHFCALWQNKCF